MNAQEMYDLMNRRQFSRDFASELIMNHLEVISRYLKNEMPLAVFCGFEDTDRGSGHSLAAVITAERLVIGAHDVREDRVWEVWFREVSSVSFADHCLVLEASRGTMRIRVNDSSGERLVRMIRQLIPAEQKETE
jgi:hypothetical protein